MEPLGLIALVAAYALADRFAGGGWPALDDRLPGRAAFWGAVLCAGVGWATFGLPAALLALAWLIWRAPGWKIIRPGSATPRGVKEIAATFIRHAIPIPLSLPVAIWTGADPVRLAALMAVFALAATVLAAVYGKAVSDPDADGDDADRMNGLVELLRGAAFGLCAAIGLGGI